MTSAPDEIELKLDLPRGELRSLARLKRLGGYRLEQLETVELQTTYLDTSDRRLAAAKIAFRIRREADQWEATLKWAGRVRDGLHRRPELNIRLRSAPTFPWRPRHAPLRAELEPILGGVPVAPILITNIVRQRRAVRAIESGPVLAELDLDEVAIRGPGGTRVLLRYAEVEIECRAGELANLRTLGRQIAEQYAAVPTAETKFSRGMRALGNS